MTIKEEFKKEYIAFQCKIVSHHNNFNVEGISSAQYNILDYLEKEGSKTTRDLAEALNITVSAVSKLNKKLLEKHMIMQTRDENDRRYFYNSITDEGRGFLKRAEASRNEIVKGIEDSLTDEELKEFIHICKKINESI
ncbi:MarR family winged helix-turn-helix transcriptional regulator [Clostridium amazonitimonense]|uniref:MarR family winged helix-turn-helix transcriptional regulator n=1 Tax=Clostridium amazonitimonense TaxID=1499689 RepID=UPI0005099CDF|nr:MarR family transcriptional regulator [Clostridium amazonitimonense]